MLNQYEPSVFCVEHSQTVEPIPDQGRGQVRWGTIQGKVKSLTKRLEKIRRQVQGHHHSQLDEKSHLSYQASSNVGPSLAMAFAGGPMMAHL